MPLGSFSLSNPQPLPYRNMTFPDDIVIQISEAVIKDEPRKLTDILLTFPSPDLDELGSWLSLAAAEGSLGCLSVLIKFGADVNYQSEDGESPFSYACANNQLESAKLLHSAGANVNGKLSSGLTPLDCAVCSSSPEFRHWLRSVGGTRTGTYPEWPWPPTPTDPH
jgi:ankyrin repeat protein